MPRCGNSRPTANEHPAPRVEPRPGEETPKTRLPRFAAAALATLTVCAASAQDIEQRDRLLSLQPQYGHDDRHAPPAAALPLNEGHDLRGRCVEFGPGWHRLPEGLAGELSSLRPR